MSDFSDFIDSCNLIDLPLEGGRFTWSSHEEMPVLSRIDRFLFTCDWEEHFQGMHQVLLSKITLDHFPIMLQGRDVASVKRPFKFENMWLEVDGFCELVSSFWGELRVSGFSSFVLAKKLLFLKRRLKEWNKEVFGHLESKLAEFVVKIKAFDEKEQQLALSLGDRLVRLQMKRELPNVRSQIDLFWRQRAKQHWMEDGDRNTKFFHRVASMRRRFNAIDKIVVEGSYIVMFLL